MTDLLRPAGVAPPETTAEDPRIGHLLGTAVGPEAPPRAVLVGFPSDQGVRRNGGRTGASEGPDAIRRRLYGLTPPPERLDAVRELLATCADLGNLEVSGEVEADQERLGRTLAPHLERGAFVIVLGGGHETAFGHFLGHVEAGLAPEILNWDAHADVRELADGRAHSGSPFRQALLHPSGACRRYRVAGLLPHSVAADHLQFVTHRGGSWTRGAELDGQKVDSLYASLATPALVSFDLDAVDQAHAPGVSAPATGGMAPDLWLRAAREAGRSRAVASADLVELNPRLDRDGQTARLAALTAWQILVGVAERGTGCARPAET